MAIKKIKISPRQKMINLMYVVLMAMLALNISTEVLNGFSIVEESLNRTTGNSTKENEAIYRELEQIMRKNPAKARVWFQRATTVRAMSDSLFNYAQELKTLIVREADGPEGDPLHIKNKDNLEAAGVVMLSPGTGQGRKLFDAINSYRERILRLIDDPLQKQIISSNLSTTVPSAALNKNWEEYMFEDMPTAAPLRCFPSCRVTYATRKARCFTRSWPTWDSRTFGSTSSKPSSSPTRRASIRARPSRPV